MESRRSVQLLQVIDGKLVDTMSNQSLNEQEVNNLLKSLTEWFGEKLVDISRPRKGGGSYRTTTKKMDINKSENMINGYPAATQDISVNIKNRQECIDVANYGPMNPLLSNDEYWQARADVYKTSIEEAKASRCYNCAAFIQTVKMKEAIAQGLGGEEEAYAIAELANLGYCEIFDFKCAGKRTCDAWVVGGPITDANIEVEKNYDNISPI
jgi:hypothetical protein